MQLASLRRLAQQSLTVLLAAALWLGAAGCFEAGVKHCSFGFTCPPEMACDEIHAECVFPGQLSACDGADDQAPLGATGTPVIVAACCRPITPVAPRASAGSRAA